MIEHNRRNVLRATLALGFSLTCPALAHANTSPRALAMHNLHTGESVETVYWADGRYQPDGLAALNTLLRDHRADEVGAMDPRVLEQVHEIHRLTGSREPVHIISGYRTARTNAKLRKKSNGVAKKSFHMRGMAIDLRIPGVSTERLRDLAKSMQAGGVGYYPKSGFIHVDAGRVRAW